MSNKSKEVTLLKSALCLVTEQALFLHSDMLRALKMFYVALVS